MMHKSGRNDVLSPGASCSGKETPGASTKNETDIRKELYLRDYITRKQESDNFFDKPVPKKLTFDEWYSQQQKDTGYKDPWQNSEDAARDAWKAAQENK